MYYYYAVNYSSDIILAVHETKGAKVTGVVYTQLHVYALISIIDIVWVYDTELLIMFFCICTGDFTVILQKGN